MIRACVTGRVTKQGVELRKSKKGNEMQVCKVAVDPRSPYTRQKDDDPRPDRLFVRVTGMGRTGEALAQAHAGDMVTVMGTLDRAWWQPKPTAKDPQPERKEMWSMFAESVFVPSAQSNQAALDGSVDELYDTAGRKNNGEFRDTETDVPF